MTWFFGYALSWKTASIERNSSSERAAKRGTRRMKSVLIDLQSNEPGALGTVQVVVRDVGAEHDAKERHEHARAERQPAQQGGEEERSDDRSQNPDRHSEHGVRLLVLLVEDPLDRV